MWRLFVCSGAPRIAWIRRQWYNQTRRTAQPIHDAGFAQATGHVERSILFTSHWEEQQMETHIVVESERLYVRTWRPEDGLLLYRVLSDPDVHVYTAEEPWTEAQAQEMVAWCIEHRLGWEPGYFNCPLVRRASERGGDERLLGRVGLNPFDEDARVPEIEWTLGRAYWGQGYATEIGRAILRYGFEQAGFDEIVGFARSENAASRRVMVKIGMQYTGDQEHDGRICSFYSARLGL
jgi:RimJ/RimL family protein N-acetyltransferase